MSKLVNHIKQNGIAKSYNIPEYCVSEILKELTEVLINNKNKLVQRPRRQPNYVDSFYKCLYDKIYTINSNKSKILIRYEDEKLMSHYGLSLNNESVLYIEYYKKEDNYKIALRIDDSYDYEYIYLERSELSDELWSVFDWTYEEC